jgi:RNA polymerase sigma-70 factor (ECF subfamily)
MINNRIDPALSARVDASDIVQDVMLEAHRRLSDYLRNPEAMPFHLWLRHIALDHIIDAHRKHRVAKRRSLDREKPLVISGMNDQSSIELAGQLLANEVTPASAAIHAELKSRLDSAINLLEPDDREIVLMRHAEQMTNQEVSALLGLTEAAASMRYLRAVRKLRSGLLPGGL